MFQLTRTEIRSLTAKKRTPAPSTKEELARIAQTKAILDAAFKKQP
jgi:hypothetical protein